MVWRKYVEYIHCQDIFVKYKVQYLKYKDIFSFSVYISIILLNIINISIILSHIFKSKKVCKKQVLKIYKYF